jgi:hypothetical protein
MKAASSKPPGDQSPVRKKGSSEHASQQVHRGHVFYEIIAILVIGIATMLALVLLQMITAGP